MVKLLSPAGDWIALRAAVSAGADEVYIGLKQLSMRAMAKNFDVSELPKIVSFCHDNAVRVNLAVNTIVYDDEIDKVIDILSKAKNAGIDAVICWDFSIIQACLRLGLRFHVSTQASVSNLESARFYAGLGAERIIFARELSLDQIRVIKDALPGVEVEVFCHGAMCVSVSGRCFMSQEIFGRSANRGECLQPCRREYFVDDSGSSDNSCIPLEYGIRDVESEFDLCLGSDYVMSPKDLCTLEFLEKLVPFVDVIKIEGRMRSPEYVKVVTESYRSALDTIASGLYSDDMKKQLLAKVRTVYNRGFSSGFFLGKPVAEWTDVYGSKATATKEFIGFVKNYYEQAGAAEVHVQAGSVAVGDTIMFQGNKTGVFEQVVESIQIDSRKVSSASKGLRVGIKTSMKVRPNDKVFIIRSV